MRRQAMGLALIAAILPAASLPARPVARTGIKAIFAQHDPSGRLQNTEIKYAGTIHLERNSYRVYDLNFTNPVSEHGMQRIAIVLNGKTFLGSYQTEGQKISVRGTKIVSAPDTWCKTETSIRLKGPSLLRNVMFACDLRELEHTI